MGQTAPVLEPFHHRRSVGLRAWLCTLWRL